MAVTIDLMEYANDAAAQAAYKSSSDPASWDITNDCSSLTGWTTAGTVTQETFDSKSTFKFVTTGSGTSNAYAYKDLGTIASSFTIDIDIYFDLLGTTANTDPCRLIVRQDATHTLMMQIGTDQVRVYDGAGWVQVGTPTITQDAWQTWRFVVDGTGQTVDIYRYNWDSGVWDTIATGADVSYSGGGTAGEFRLDAYGYTTATIVYLDNIKIENALNKPDLACFSEGTIKTQGTYSLKGVAAITGSLNDTLTRTVDPTIDLSDQDVIKMDIRASRTGSNIKIGFHDAGGVTTEHTANVLSADTFQTEDIDISGVANADKDAIDSITVTITNADA